MTRIKLVLSLALVVLVALAATACGGSSDGGSGEPGGGNGGKDRDPQAAALAWATCMRDNGVDIPDPKPQDEGGGQLFLAPGVGGPLAGTDEKTFTAAKKACSEHAEDMGGPGAAGFGEEDKQRMVDFARCMREQGIDMPDPDFDGSDGRIAIEIDPNDPDFDAAREACKKFSGGMPGGTP